MRACVIAPAVRTGVLAVAAILESCSHNGASQTAEDNAGPFARGDAAASVMLSSSAGVGANRCKSTVEAKELGLESLPYSIAAFRQVGAGCQSLRQVALVRNVGESDVVVEGISVPDGVFDIEPMSLPKQLASGESLPLTVGYWGAETVKEHLTVQTDAGCTEFSLVGIATEETVVSRSHLSLDFGNIAADGLSPTRVVNILLQRGVDSARVELGGFSVSPGSTFELVDAPTEPLQLEDCEPFSFGVRVNAPSVLGDLSGSLAWHSSVSGGGTSVGEALIVVPLLARVVE